MESRLPRAALWAGAALVLGAWALSSLSVLDDDPFVMGEVAQHVVAGKRLYATIWDNKPPLAILIYALPQLVASGSYLGLQLTGGLWALAQAWLWLALCPGGSRVVRVGGAALLALLPLSDFRFAWLSSEDASNGFALVALLGAYRSFDSGRIAPRDALLMGAALALAFHARQTSALLGLPCLVSLALAEESPRRKLEGAAWLAAGGLAAWAAVIALVLAVGDFRGYVYAVFVAPGRYAGQPRGLIELVSEFRNSWSTFAIAAAVGFLQIVPRVRLFAAAVGAATLLSAVAPMRAHFHYWEQVIPGLVLLAHMVARELAPTRRALWALAMLPAFVLANVGWTLAKCVTDRSTARAAAAARAIDSQARPGDHLFVGGKNAGTIYFFTRTEPANMYFWEYYLYGVAGVLPTPLETVLAQYREHPPEILVLGDDMLGAVRAAPSGSENVVVKLIRDWFAQRGYDAVELAAAAPWHVYRLEGLSPPRETPRSGS
ncbi:MAG TPA: hypothetical protein VMR86_02745 [Myxococcota bacterium]|nr:hypothetical protein [Myxococcota bacterium]